MRASRQSTTAQRGSTAPPAARIPASRVTDPRLWGGVLLVLASAVAGAALLSRGPDTVTVWRATRDLARGAAPSGLEPVRVARELAGDAYATPEDSAGRVLARPIAAGELVPLSALDAADAERIRRVTVPVDPLHAPVGLMPGDAVDLWASAGDPSTDVSSPVLVLSHTVVASVADDASGLGGELGVVLAVPVDRVPDVVRATRGGTIDLVAVPLADQEATPW